MILGAVSMIVLAVVSARPRYIAIPLEDVQFIEVADYSSPLVRVTRQAGFQARDSDDEDSSRFQRGAHGGGGDGHDYVDYGAHTGHHGAFGWYADFPVLKH
ncbi:hypothetical protein L9F63_003891 [Diploptera punctata]|uniref:Uncharacterized protein n=1 Tax=Diploptera punctata TaxID=6984 RepID=A0AAD7ZKL4_DIPPU|nr:hypothetical protein L9F63_003891 [Diploptera punctata]